jgi:hypothetical protein
VAAAQIDAQSVSRPPKTPAVMGVRNRTDWTSITRILTLALLLDEIQ